MIWIILLHTQKLHYLKIQLLISYPVSSLFAKLGISNVGVTDNGPRECSFLPHAVIFYTFLWTQCIQCLMRSWKWVWALLMLIIQIQISPCLKHPFTNSDLFWALLNWPQETRANVLSCWSVRGLRLSKFINIAIKKKQQKN